MTRLLPLRRTAALLLAAVLLPSATFAQPGALTAEQVFADFKRSLALKRRDDRRQAHAHESGMPPVAPVVRRETRG